MRCYAKKRSILDVTKHSIRKLLAGEQMRLFWISAAMLFATGCTSSMIPEKASDSPDWNGKVQQWGALREVMHGEVMDGQVRLSEAIEKPHVCGIGAPGKLHGEIVITDSVAWVATFGTVNVSSQQVAHATRS